MRNRLTLFVGAWLLTVGFGFRALALHEFTPGAAGRPPTRLAATPDAFSVVVSLHPRCPCSRATLDELAYVMTRASKVARAKLLFVRPAGVEPGFERGELWDTASRVPGAVLESDPEGRESARLGLKTSGHVLAYAPSGRLVFTGGITGSRGHRGQNDGRDNLLAALLGRSRGLSEAPVYGCRLAAVDLR